MRKGKKYIYPKVPAEYDLGYIRFGGAGLANCMFVAARAWVLHKQTQYEFIAPTWEKFSPGPYLRREKDKRHYMGLFRKRGISGLQKLWLLTTKSKIQTIEEADTMQSGIITVQGLGKYYEDLLEHHEEVKAYFDSIILPKHFEPVNSYDFSDKIGVHIRLGDYISEWRTDISWYRNMITELQKRLTKNYRFIIFSDGTEEELRPLTDLPNTERVFFGSALSDILGLSRCQLIIGSDSTFSGWGAFLGQVPIIFPKTHFGRVLKDQYKEVSIKSTDELSLDIINRLTSN